MDDLPVARDDSRRPSLKVYVEDEENTETTAEEDAERDQLTFVWIDHHSMKVRSILFEMETRVFRSPFRSIPAESHASTLLRLHLEHYICRRSKNGTNPSARELLLLRHNIWKKRCFSESFEVFV